MYYAKNLTKLAGGARVWLKREDLAHTGAHKINNALGQLLLAKAMGKTRIIAETGAGQHGVATATACALMGMPCTVYMGAEDIERQALNAFRMKMLGTTVASVDSGSKTLKDAINEAMRDWVTNVATTHYCPSSRFYCRTLFSDRTRTRCIAPVQATARILIPAESSLPGWTARRRAGRRRRSRRPPRRGASAKGASSRASSRPSRWPSAAG